MLLDVEKFKKYAWITDTSWKASVALERAEAFSKSILPDIWEDTYTEFHDWDGSNEITLLHGAITSVEYVKIHGSTITPEDYSARWYALRLKYCSGPRWYDAIEIRYTAWYTAATLPGELLSSIYEIARAYYLNWEENISSESVDWASVSYNSVKYTDAVNTLHSYKRIYV